MFYGIQQFTTDELSLNINLNILTELTEFVPFVTKNK